MGELIALAIKLWGGVDPCSRRTNPNWATVIGFVAGGIGLAIYFRTLVDLLVPVFAAIILTLVIGDFGWFVGAFFAACYGYFRAAESNARRVQRGLDAPSPNVIVPPVQV